ncbi:MAG: HAD family phosphatase [Treponema sp.]|nr:HAD family phosphatase [Treponema sp.]
MELSCKNLNGVIFDIDGTLLDSMSIWGELGTKYLRSYGIDAGVDFNKIARSMTIEEGVSYLKQRFNIEKSESEIKKGLVAILADFYLKEVQLKPGAENLVKQFAKKQIPMALATSGDSRLAIPALERLNLMKYFVILLTCGQLNTNKGEPLIFLRAMENLGSDGERKKYIIIEDSLQALKTASAAGFRTLGILDESSESDWDEIKKTADCWVESLEEVTLVD